MVHESHNPDDFVLAEPLRAAVERVKRAEPPLGSVDRALARAADIGRRTAPGFGPRVFLMSGALAATLFLGFALRWAAYPPGGFLAKNLPEPSIEAIDTTPIVERPGRPADVWTVGGLSSEWNRWERQPPPAEPTFDLSGASFLVHRSGPLVWRPGTDRVNRTRIADSDGRSLVLEKIDVSVRVEGGRARTVVDHVFHNPHPLAIEGGFDGWLPAGATPSWFSMADATMARAVAPSPSPEAVARAFDGCVGANGRHAVVVGQEIHPGPPSPLVYARPANTFHGRLGPVGAGARVRVVYSFEELLAYRDGHLAYAYPFPEGRVDAASFVLLGDKGERVMSRTWSDAAPGEVTVRLAATDGQFTTGRAGASGPLYMHGRVRLATGDAKPAFAKHAVFLLDTSAAESASRFDLRVRLAKRILEADPDIAFFNVLTFNSSAAWAREGWFANDAAGRKAALGPLEGMLLEGATDLSAALTRLRTVKSPAHAFLLSDGRVSAGESSPARLARAGEGFRWHCYANDSGEENAELFSALTRDGGTVARLTGDADLAAAASAHRVAEARIREVRFVGAPKASDVFLAGDRRVIPAGGDLIVAARFDRPGPVTMVVTGDGFSRRYDVDVRPGGDLAARAWGEAAMSSLLASRRPSLDAAAKGIGRSLNIGSRVTAFALPRDGEPLVMTAPPTGADFSVLAKSGWAIAGREAVAEAPAAPLAIRPLVEARPVPAPRPSGVPTTPGAAYLAARKGGPLGMRAFLDEAARRAEAGDTDGAAHCATSLLDTYPDRADVTRLVAYSLTAMGRADDAVALLSRLPDEAATRYALARALDESGSPVRASLAYDALLARPDGGGKYAAPARAERELVARRLVAVAKAPEAKAHFAERITSEESPAATMTWSSDAAGVELVVIDAKGNRATSLARGPTLGPVALPLSEGATVRVVYRDGPPSLPEVCVRVELVTRTAPERVAKRVTLTLRRPGDSAEVK